MDERLDYSSEEQLRKASSDWQLEQDGVGPSLERESSTLLLQFRDYHLHIVQKKEEPSERPFIPATTGQRLALYRHYLSTPHKTNIVPMPFIDFNQFLWQYVLNVVFKSMSHTYTHVFLASYTPEEHIFVSKMVPLMHGIKFAIVLASALELMTFTAHSVDILGYLIDGLLFTNPWNRCDDLQNMTAHLNALNTTKLIHCLNVEDYKAAFANRRYNNTKSNSGNYANNTWHFEDETYAMTDTGQILMASHVLYMIKFFKNSPNIVSTIYIIILFVGASMCYEFAFKTKFWKIFSYVQWMTIGMELSSFMFLCLATVYQESSMGKSDSEYRAYVSVTDCDVNLLTQTITAPPIVHILTARSIQEIEPEADSAVMIVSNALLYLFRGILSYKLKKYCDNSIGAEVPTQTINTRAWYIYWPMYFSYFYLGDLYTIFFFLLYFSLDFLTIIVIYHCFVEIIIWEWKWMKVWMVQSFMTIISVILYYLDGGKIEILVKVYLQTFVSFMEVLSVYAMYPVGRLKDDITFHSGCPPPTLRILSFKLMPVFCFVKAYMIMATFMYEYNFSKESQVFRWTWVATVLPYVVGVIIVLYIFVWSERGGWRRLIVPESEWGPKDYDTRQLRKRYDSRIYIGPTAPRALSRYMITKAEAKSFQLDLQYDPKRRSTLPTSMYRLETLTKKEV